MTLLFMPSALLVSFLPSTLAYIFALRPTNLIIVTLLFSSFIRSGTFLFTTGIRVAHRIIARANNLAILRFIVSQLMWYKIIKTGSNSGLLRESVGWEVRRGGVDDVNRRVDNVTGSDVIRQRMISRSVRGDYVVGNYVTRDMRKIIRVTRSQ